MYIHENQSRDDQIVDARSGQVEKKIKKITVVCLRCLNTAAERMERATINLFLDSPVRGKRDTYNVIQQRAARIRRTYGKPCRYEKM